MLFREKKVNKKGHPTFYVKPSFPFQKILLLHNVDPMVQICCCGKYTPPWWRGTDLVAVQHRDLRNEMHMLHPDSRVTLMLAFVALFSTRYCSDSLADKPAVDEARESGREMLKQFLVRGRP